ncbi:MAG: hypothetical protein HYZ34_14995 [Ignavibacteriae bacterium]|nr:hypothetical protein [Ignavibacteriota bacterium]
MLWSVTLKSNKRLTEAVREFITVEAISSRCKKGIILHDAFDVNEKSMEFILEATGKSIKQLFPFSWGDNKFKFRIKRI